MELQFLGSGSAFSKITENFQSNMVVKSDSGHYLLIDCGSDARHSLAALGLGQEDIESVYISHLHADHAGGLEWLAFTSRFSSNPRRPKLYIHPRLLNRLWDKVLCGGLQSLEGDRPAALADYYEVMPIAEDESFTWNEIYFQMIKTKHVCNGKRLAHSYGLFMTTKHSKVFITTDTQFTPKEHESYFEQADLIFHDCDTGQHKSPVHAHFDELATLPKAIKAKMWLYHYPTDVGFNPIEQGFLGFVRKGQMFNI